MNQLKIGALLNYVIIALNVVTGILYTPYMLRCLGQNEYGIYTLVASVITYLTLLDFGLSGSVTKFIAESRATKGKEEEWSLYGMFLLIYIIIGCIVALGGTILYLNIDAMFDRTMSADELYQAKIMMIIMVLNMVFFFPLSVFSAIISAYERFIFARVTSIIKIVLLTVALVLVLIVGFKAIALVLVQSVFSTGFLILNVVYCFRNLKIKIRFKNFNIQLLKNIMSFSLWNFLGAMVDRVYWSTGQFVLGIMSGPVSVAIYSLSISLMGMYMSLSTSVSSVLLPRLTTLAVKKENDKEISDIFIRMSRLQFVIMSIVLSGFVTFGMSFIKLWAGADYADTYYCSIIFFVALLCPLIQNVGITILVARGQLQFRTLCYIGIALICLLCQIFLSHQWGAVGCASAVGVSLFAGQWIVMNVYYYKAQHLDIPSFWRQIGRMSIVPLIFSTVGYLAVSWIQIDTWMQLVSGIFMYIILYVPTFWYFSMGEYEKRQFTPLLNKLGFNLR